MAEKLLLLLLIYLGTEILAQPTSYSLQEAVDALRRREAQLALRNNFNEPPPSHFMPAPSEEEEYWGQEPVSSPSIHVNRHQLNKLLARYLARDDDEREHDGGLGTYEPDFDDDNYIPEERKRSFFRERGSKYEPPYASVFRERELAPYETPELAEEFLREIEHEKDLEREQKYKEALQKLWEKYEQQENEIKEDLFEDEKKKRQLLPYISPMEKKRSYPVLPWLPASRKKRFPVTKRSPRASNEGTFGASGTDERVAHDLEAIFSEPNDDKKKRSAENGPLTTPESTGENNVDKKSMTPKPHGNEHNHHSSHDENSSEEDSHEGHDHAHDHDHEEDEDDDHDFDDEDEEDRKKKREIAAKKRSTQEILREDQIIPGDLSSLKKKSVDWSKYFGMDRRKKSENWFMRNSNEVKKRSPIDEDDKRKKKSDVDEEKLDNMDKKLKTIEDLIIDETVKYTGAHEGISDPDEIRHLKDHVVSKLATAYSLEKMRRALDKLKQSIDNENHLQRNEIESETGIEDKEKEKRIAVKKEKAEYDNNQHSSEQPEEKSHESTPNELDENDDDKKKKKKRNGGGIPRHHSDLNLSDFEDELGAGHFEPQLYDGYSAGRNYNYLDSSQCPMLDAMAERCRNVDLISGDIRQEFLPICGVHQLCYLCGTSQTACDFQYLSEADSLCGRNNDCQSAARAALMILRGTPGPQLGPKECMRNNCLYRAMKEIGL